MHRDTLALTLLGLVLLPPPARANTYGAPILLDPGNAQSNYAQGIADDGRIVGYETTASGDRGLVWEGLQPNHARVLQPSSGTNVIPFASAPGAPVVGNQDQGSARPLAWVGGSTTPVELQTLGGGAGDALGVRSDGVIVGDAADSEGAIHAATWASATDAPHQLADLAPEGGVSQASAINASGKVAGLATSASGSFHAVIWASPTTTLAPTDLGMLAGGNFSFANAINAAGAAVGQGDDAGGISRALYWAPDGAVVNLAPTDVAFDPNGASNALAIDDLGWIVGSADLVGGLTTHALLWRVLGDGSVFSFDLGAAWTAGSSFATGIDSAGNIVGYGLDESGAHALLWRNLENAPVPEPATASLIGLGLAAIAARRRKR